MTKQISAKYSLTKNQSLVLNALAKADQPLGAYELLNRLQSSGFKAPLQVYRALDQLVEKGRVHRLESLNAWTACCEGQHSYTPVFAICDDCGIVTEHFDEQLAGNIEKVTKRSGFTPDRSIIEIHGQCDDCGTITQS
jgi:Fur family zinc uptake transcriptional regulator